MSRIDKTVTSPGLCVNESLFFSEISNVVRFCRVAADGDTTSPAVKSDEVTMTPLASVDMDERPVEDLSLMRRSRKSLSLDNLQSVAAAADDRSPGDDPGGLRSSQSVMYARSMNQSFRAAVDKSFDGPSLAASLAGESASFQGHGGGGGAFASPHL